ncbi:MAG: hypothetical protein AAFQ41_07760, partial [Cyanobacteria bacterium J06623_7]
MKHFTQSQAARQTLLILNRDQARLSAHSTVLASFNQIYFSFAGTSNILPWIQQNQPDLIVLDFTWSETVNLQL